MLRYICESPGMNNDRFTFEDRSLVSLLMDNFNHPLMNPPDYINKLISRHISTGDAYNEYINPPTMVQILRDINDLPSMTTDELTLMELNKFINENNNTSIKGSPSMIPVIGILDDIFSKTTDDTSLTIELLKDTINELPRMCFFKIPNINSLRYVYMIDILSTISDKVILLKPVVTDITDISIYVFVERPVNGFIYDRFTKGFPFPVNTTGIIDILYCMYCRSLYVSNLGSSVVINGINDEYKRFVNIIANAYSSNEYFLWDK